MSTKRKAKTRAPKKPKFEPIRVVEDADEYFLPGDIVEIDDPDFKQYIRNGVRYYIFID